DFCNTTPRTAIIRAMPRPCQGRRITCRRRSLHACVRGVPPVAGLVQAASDARRRLVRIAQIMPAQVDDSPI
ncbi:TPA: hypothetical protein ACYLK1_001598, partial [Burkholderia cenocepacia]